MARKKSVGGRARQVQSLAYQVERANRQLARLSELTIDGLDASEILSARTLQRNLSTRRSVKLSKGRKARQRIKIQKAISHNDRLFIQKQLRHFLESETSTTTGIKRKITETRAKIKKTLEAKTGEKLTDKDIIMFQQLTTEDAYNYIADKIGASKTYQLLKHAEKNHLSKESFLDLLSQYMTLNSKEARDCANKLYEDFVR